MGFSFKINDLCMELLNERADREGKSVENLMIEILEKAALDIKRIGYAQTKAEKRLEKIEFIKRHYAKA